MEVPIVGVVLALSLCAVIVHHLDRVLDISLTSWLLRKQGVSDTEIRKIAIASAKRKRRPVLLQVVDRILDLLKARRK